MQYGSLPSVPANKKSKSFSGCFNAMYVRRVYVHNIYTDSQ